MRSIHLDAVANPSAIAVVAGSILVYVLAYSILTTAAGAKPRRIGILGGTLAMFVLTTATVGSVHGREVSSTMLDADLPSGVLGLPVLLYLTAKFAVGVAVLMFLLLEPADQ